ncbi:MAG: GGDEF domain-containing protein [Mycolicibacterium cosmeticum]|nr:GGDEF domain-containing protein [Mycolicibacterium cosmeticum]
MATDTARRPSLLPPLRTGRAKGVAGALGGIGLSVFVVAMLVGKAALPAATAPLGLLAVGALASGCAFRAARAACGGQRSAWGVLAVGLSGWVLGDAVWAAAAIAGSVGAVSGWCLGLGYALLPISGLIAAVLVPSTPGTGFGLRLLLDGVLITSSLLMIAVIAARHYDISLDMPWAMSMPFTATYFGLAVVTTVVISKSGAGQRWSPSLTATGFFLLGTGGVLYGQLARSGGDITVLPVVAWACGLYAFALAATTSHPGPAIDTVRRPAPSRLHQWLPVAPLIVATTLGSLYLWPDSDNQIAVFSIGLVMAATVVGRQLLLLDHNRRLLRATTPATGLATRRRLDEHLRNSVRRHAERASPICVVIIGLSDFAMIKSAVGPGVSEALLHEARARVLANAGPARTVARLSEDTLAIVVDDTCDAATTLATDIVAAFDEPLGLSGRPVNVHVRFGLACPAADALDPVTADGLLADALSALEGARSATSTGQSLCATDPPGHELAEPRWRGGLDRVRFIHQLRVAVDNADLTLLYQPKFDLRTQTLSGVEALLRWPHDELGVLSPADFLPLVGELGLLDAVTDIVLQRAISDAAWWSTTGPAIPVAVNMSAPTLIDPALPRRITSLLGAHHVAASTLTVEITEDLLISDLDQARSVLHRLRESGVRVAIDDFGSGYGSMTYLRVLPIDDVKIDRPFVAPIVYDVRAAAIVKAMIELAGELGIATTAEGVENQETADKLKLLGCDFVQGNFFSRPLSAEDVRATYQPQQRDR